jgi:hypothetical protein
VAGIPNFVGDFSFNERVTAGVLLLVLLLQLSFHLVAVVVTLVQTKHKNKMYKNETIQKHSTHNTC